MKKPLVIACAVWLANLMALAQPPPVPTCTLHIADSTVGSCMDCPTQEHPEFCSTETTYYDYWCPPNGACDVGYHCGESAEKQKEIVSIEYGCTSCCDEPGDPYCEYDMGDVDVYEDYVPEDCVCYYNEQAGSEETFGLRTRIGESR